MINECNGKFVCQSPNEICDVTNKESLLEKLRENREDIDELVKTEQGLWRQCEQINQELINLFKIELINRNIKGKCFVSIRDIHNNGADIKDIEYFRVLGIEHVYSEYVTLTCDLFHKYETESKTLFKFGNDSVSYSHKDISENNEISPEVFYQKRDEFWDEYKTYMT